MTGYSGRSEGGTRFRRLVAVEQASFRVRRSDGGKRVRRGVPVEQASFQVRRSENREEIWSVDSLQFLAALVSRGSEVCLPPLDKKRDGERRVTR